MHTHTDNATWYAQFRHHGTDKEGRLPILLSRGSPPHWNEEMVKSEVFWTAIVWGNALQRVVLTFNTGALGKRADS